jgi:hypothetical protein
MIPSPKALDWQYGPVPLVEGVPFDCIIVLWSENYVGIIAPNGDSLNPLRWADSGGMPLWGIDRPIGWWTWFRKGSKQRPPEVKTWAEKHETPEILAWKAHCDSCEQCKKTSEASMKQSLNSRLRLSDMKDYTSEYCTEGQNLLSKLYREGE